MTERRQRHLFAAGLFFGVASAVHILDHLRRGQGSVSDELNAAGLLALVMQVVVVTLVVTRHRLAPLVAAAVGLPLALGFFTAHWLPEWSALSDPVWEIGSWTWFSYVASSLEILTALAVGVVGLIVVRERGLESFARQEPSQEPSLPRAG